jgi:urease accessory protein
MTTRILYDLMSWMSPAWPVGAFAHSSGLEWAVEDGLVTDRRSAEAWIADSLDHGAARTDAALFAFAHRATERGDAPALLEIAELATALQTTAERRLESVAQGAAFRRIARSAAAAPQLAWLDPLPDEDLAYPVAVGCLTAAHAAPRSLALTAYLHGTVGNLASAAQRLVPLGQTDGQLVIAALRDRVEALATWAAGLDEEDPLSVLGAAAFVSEIASMAHETQYTRLFRT